MSQPAEEILNLDYNISLLCVIALNKYSTKRRAAKELGMTVRNLYRLIRRYNIKREGEYWGKYFILETKLKVA